MIIYIVIILIHFIYILIYMFYSTYIYIFSLLLRIMHIKQYFAGSD